MNKNWLLFVLLVIISGCSRQGQTIEAGANDTRIQICFTPGQDCTAMLIDQINAAHREIEVQAYSFTSYPIAKALVQAAKRGVNVEVILDKSQFDSQHFSVSKYLFKKGVMLYEDDTVNIAHNKIMIFDENSVETGSFNFTNAAQSQNAENMLIIDNAAVAAAYNNNWQGRRENSKKVSSSIFQN